MRKHDPEISSRAVRIKYNGKKILFVKIARISLYRTRDTKKFTEILSTAYSVLLALSKSTLKLHLYIKKLKEIFLNNDQYQMTRSHLYNVRLYAD